MKRYYSVARPISAGTFPRIKDNPVEGIHNFDRREYVETIGREAWGYVEYDHAISKQDAKDYELIAEEENKNKKARGGI